MGTVPTIPLGEEIAQEEGGVSERSKKLLMICRTVLSLAELAFLAYILQACLRHCAR